MTTTTDRIRAKKIVIERREPIHVLFAATDTKGRRFGARVRVELIEWDHADADALCPYLIPEANLGRWVHVLPHATRDAADYGAWQGGAAFRTEDEAQAYIAKYFADAEKRALKNKKRAA